MSKPKIKPVESNIKKGKTYASIISKYNQAMENGYYGEAELIVYAFMEDRLRSFLYYCGVLKKDKRNINDDFVELYGKESKIDKISTKIDMIEQIFKLCNDKSIENDLIVDARKIIKYAFKENEVKKTLKDIKKWCGYRDEIVHALFNKDIDYLRSIFADHVESGFLLARKVDGYVNSMKKV